jgi:aspartate-semialdehyde dehydrogenase
MSADRLPCAILGAGGYIGQHFARLLADHPLFGPPVLVGSERVVGRSLEETWRLSDPPPAGLEGSRYVERSPSQLVREGVEVVFGALPSGVAGRIESECARRGISVFSNSADHRMDPKAALLVPEVNPHHLGRSRRPRGTGLIVTNPNCTATGLVLALTPWMPLLDPEWISVTTYQALSGAGYPGVPSLAIQDNVVPFIDGEEEKVALESAHILDLGSAERRGPGSTRFLVQCARVAVREGHLEAVTLRARRRPTVRALGSAIRSFDPLGPMDLPTAPHPPVLLREEKDRPQPLRDRWAGSPARARGMAATIGRVRWEPPFLRFFLLSHNAVRGGAGGSVLNAELAFRKGLLAHAGAVP